MWKEIQQILQKWGETLVRFPARCAGKPQGQRGDEVNEVKIGQTPLKKNGQIFGKFS